MVSDLGAGIVFLLVLLCWFIFIGLNNPFQLSNSKNTLILRMTAEELQSGHLFLLDKPLDWTSFQAVNKLKYKLKREFKELPKKFKIGHAGTLDPRATGLLIVCTGKFTNK